MNVSVYLPFLASLVICLASPVVARRGRPAVTAIVLSAVSVVAAAGSLWAMALLAVTGIDDVPALDPRSIVFSVPDPVALVAAVGVLVAAARMAGTIRRRRRVHRRVRGALHGLASGDSDVVVIADLLPDAFVVPARRTGILRRQRPQIVVTNGMLAALDDDQQQALFAHERAHLDGGHHLLRAAADLAAAASPLLIPARDAVGFLCERSADERAGAAVGSRNLVAAAIATAALAHGGGSSPKLAAGAALATSGAPLAFNGLATVDRVVALQRPAPTALRLVVVGAILVAVGILAADANATGELIASLRALF